MSPVTSISTGNVTSDFPFSPEPPALSWATCPPAGASAAGATRVTRPLNFFLPVAVEVNSTRLPAATFGTSASRTSARMIRRESSAIVMSLPCGMSPSCTSTLVTSPAIGA